MRRPHLLRWLLLAGSLAACATAPAGAARSAPRAPAAERAPESPVVGDPREVGPAASFADLAAAARALLRAGRTEGQNACLVQHASAGYALRADLSSGLQELPDVPVELDRQLARSRSVRVLSAHGIAGDPTSALVLASFTSLPARTARASVAALIVTDQGVYLRGPEHGAPDPTTAQEAVAQLATAPSLRGAVVYVSAEGSVPLSAAFEVLEALPEGTLAALSIVLPEGTRLPDGATAPVAGDYCPDGLPAPPSKAVEGALEPNVLREALGPLRQHAQACLDAARGPGRAGGRLKLAVRIDSSGRIAHACALEDGVGDASLLACVLDETRALTLSAPSPAGFVDAHLPLVLSPAEIAVQHPTCEEGATHE